MVCPLLFVFVFSSLMGCLPRSMLMIGHRPPIWLSIRACNNLKVIVCLDVLSFEAYLHPLMRCVFLSGWLHVLHIIGPCVLCRFFHW